MGSLKESGTFEEFTSRTAEASISFRGLKVRYESPSRGRVSFGWRGKFTAAGKTVHLNDYPRYENPWCTADYDTEEIHIADGESFLTLNFGKGKREYDLLL